MHERSAAAPLVEALGVELDGDGRRCREASKRYSRLEAGLRWTLQRRCMTGEQLDVIMGQCAFSALIDRSSLSVFGAVYKLIRARYHT
eukprot:15324145-Heterocapsa_arctica.AAC.1